MMALPALCRMMMALCGLVHATGLNRLDGYQIKKFYHHPEDQHSLVNNDIVLVIPGYQKKIGIITKEGSCYYDKTKNVFINLNKKSANKQEALISLYNRYNDFKNRILQQHNVISVDSKPINLTDFQPGFEHIYRDRQNQVWIYGGKWLLKSDTGMKHIEKVYHRDSSGIISMYQDADMHYWVGTFLGGILKFNPKDKQPFQQVNLASDQLIVFSITNWTDKDKRQWIVAGTNRGMVLLDPKSNQNKSFLPEKDNEFSIPGSEVSDVFVDRQNILWLATNSGLALIEPGKQLISSWSINPAGEEKKTDRSQVGFFSSFYNNGQSYWSSNFSKPGLIEYNDEGKMKVYLKNLCPSCSAELQKSTSQAFSIYKQDGGPIGFQQTPVW